MKELDGELALLYAVLERAVFDAVCSFACQCTSDKERLKYNKKTAKAWLLLSPLNLDDPEPFCFQWVCDYLDISPDSIRRFVRQMLKQYPLGAPLTNSRHKPDHIRDVFAFHVMDENPFSLIIGDAKREVT